MKKLSDNLANLIKVKTIVTLLLTAVFCYLSAIGTVEPNLFMAIFTTVIAFYFGTQHEKQPTSKTEHIES